MTSAQKVLEVERQVRAIVEGEQEAEFQCPFCGLASSPKTGLLCCNEASEVVSAVLDHIEHLGRVDMVDKTMDRLASMTAKSLVSMN